MRDVGPIILLAIGQTLVWASLYYVFPALLLRWEADTGWSRAELTGAIALAVLVSGLMAPVAGRFIDRGRGAELMVGAACLGAGGMAALSQVGALWQFYAIWALNGAAMAGALYEPCFAIVTRARGARARAGITAITLVAGFAGTVSFPLSNLAAEALGWRGAVQVAALVIVVLVVPLFWFGARGLGRAAAEVDPPGPRRGRFTRNPAFWFLASAFTCAALVHGSTLHHLLPFLDEQAVPAALAITIAALIGPMQVTGRVVMVAASRFVTAHVVAMAVFLLMAASVATLMLGRGQVGSLYLFVVLFGGSYGTISILRPVLAREILGGASFGAKSGALALPYMIGSASSPYLGALAWTIGGYGLMQSIGIGLAALGAVLYFGAHRLGPDAGSA